MENFLPSGRGLVRKRFYPFAENSKQMLESVSVLLEGRSEDSPSLGVPAATMVKYLFCGYISMLRCA